MRPTTESRLLRAIGWMVRRLAPATRADAILADLEQDYRSQRHRGDRRWLVFEGVSILSAYASECITSSIRRSPMILRDLQLVARGLRRGTATIVAAAALLSVGIAAVLLTAGLMDTLLLRNVSQTHGDALRRIVAVDPSGRSIMRLSLSELQTIREHVDSAGEVTAVTLQPVVMGVAANNIQTMAEVVLGPYFSLTGMTTLLGRGLSALDEHAASQPVAVLSESFWRNHLNASPDVLGSMVQFNGVAFTIVGVADVLSPTTFAGAVDAWVPAQHADPLMNPNWRKDVTARVLTAFVLPASGGPQLEAQLRSAAGALGTRFTDPWRERRLQTAAGTVMVGSQRTATSTLGLVLGGLSLLILLSAASNVSGVLVARAAANQRFAAIHMSVGAGRAVVIRRQLLEGAVIGAAAGVFAMALYAWMRIELADVAVLPTLALRLALPFGLRVFVFAVGAGAVTGIVLSIGPALWSTRADVTSALRDDGRAGEGVRATRVRRALVAAQIGLSLVLILGAALFVRSLEALSRADLGFPRDRLVALDFDLEPAVENPMALPILARLVLTRVEAIPGMEAAAMSNRAPVDSSTPTIELQRVGDDSSRVNDVTMNLATERYFDTVGVPILRGRKFTLSEVTSNADVVIVNESFAQRFWPDGDALNRAVLLVPDAKEVRVIGVARDAKYSSLSEAHRSHVYRPAAPSLTMTLLARSLGDPREALRAIQSELDRIGPGVVGFFPRTMDDHLAVQLLPTRAAANAATLLGGVALILSATALYALVSRFVVMRRREIGLRMALGASARDVRRLVVRQALVAAAPGLVIGPVLAIGLAALAQSFLFGVGPADPVAIGFAIAILTGVVFVAGYLPSLSATKVDPAEALRQ
jgi:predicted permease